MSRILECSLSSLSISLTLDPPKPSLIFYHKQGLTLSSLIKQALVLANSLWRESSLHNSRLLMGLKKRRMMLEESIFNLKSFSDSTPRVLNSHQTRSLSYWDLQACALSESACLETSLHCKIPSIGTYDFHHLLGHALRKGIFWCWRNCLIGIQIWGRSDCIIQRLPYLKASSFWVQNIWFDGFVCRQPVELVKQQWMN